MYISVDSRGVILQDGFFAAKMLYMDSNAGFVIF